MERVRTAALNVGKLRVFCCFCLHSFHDIEEYRKSFSVVFSESLRRKITLFAADEYGWLIGGNTVKVFSVAAEFFLVFQAAQHVGVRSIYIWTCCFWAPRGINAPYRCWFPAFTNSDHKALDGYIINKGVMCGHQKSWWVES